MERERRRRRGNIPPFHVVGGRYVRPKIPILPRPFFSLFSPFVPAAATYVDLCSMPREKRPRKKQVHRGGLFSLSFLSRDWNCSFLRPPSEEGGGGVPIFHWTIYFQQLQPPSLQARKGVSVRGTMGLPFPPSIPRRRLSSGRGPPPPILSITGTASSSASALRLYSTDSRHGKRRRRNPPFS